MRRALQILPWVLLAVSALGADVRLPSTSVIVEPGGLTEPRTAQQLEKILLELRGLRMDVQALKDPGGRASPAIVEPDPEQSR